MLSGWLLSLLSDDASFDVYWDTKISSLISGKPIFHSAFMRISNKLGIELNCASPWNLAEISYSLLALGPQNRAQFLMLTREDLTYWFTYLIQKRQTLKRGEQENQKSAIICSWRSRLLGLFAYLFI